MDFGNILAVDIEALDKIDREARVEAIDDAIHRLNFERRLTLLTDKQRQHMMDEEMSDAVRQRIDACKSEEERDTYISGVARTIYFRRMAWAAYLNGGTPSAPIPADEYPVVGSEPSHPSAARQSDSSRWDEQIPATGWGTKS